MKLFKTSSALLLAATVLSADPKISRDLEGVPPQAMVRVNVRYKRPVDAGKHERIGKQHGGSVTRANDDVRGATLQLPANSLKALAQDADVDYISIDRPVKGSLDYTVETSGANIAAQYGYDGRNVGVAVIDSGVRDLNDFKDRVTGKARIVYSQSFLPMCSQMNSITSGSGTGEEQVVDSPVTAQSVPVSSTTTSVSSPGCSTRTSPLDYYGHGTHVAGTIGGGGQSSTGLSYSYTIRGIAPRVNIINLRALDENGSGYDSYVIAAINRAIQLKSTYNIRVINLSLGRAVSESYNTDPLAQAVKSAWEAGIVVVCSAGNRGRDNSMNTQGYGTISSPGNSPWVITVGAMKSQGTMFRADDTIASYSSRAPPWETTS